MLLLLAKEAKADLVKVDNRDELAVAQAEKRAEVADNKAREAFKRTRWHFHGIAPSELVLAAEHTVNSEPLALLRAKVVTRHALLKTPSTPPPQELELLAAAIWPDRRPANGINGLWASVAVPLRRQKHMCASVVAATTLLKQGQWCREAALISLQLVGVVEAALTSVCLYSQKSAALSDDPGDLTALRHFLHKQKQDVTVASSGKVANLPSEFNGMEIGSLKAAAVLREKDLPASLADKVAALRAFYRCSVWSRMLEEPTLLDKLSGGSKAGVRTALDRIEVKDMDTLHASVKAVTTKSRYQVPDAKSATSSLGPMQLTAVISSELSWKAAEKSLTKEIDKASTFLCTKVLIQVVLSNHSIRLNDDGCSLGPGAAPAIAAPAIAVATELCATGGARLAAQIKPGEQELRDTDVASIIAQLKCYLCGVLTAYLDSLLSELQELPRSALVYTRKLIDRVFSCATVEGFLCEVARRRVSAYAGHAVRDYIDFEKLMQDAMEYDIGDVCVLDLDKDGSVGGVFVSNL